MLETWDTQQDLVPLQEFFRQQTEKTWEKQIERTGASVGVFYLFYLRLVQLPHQLVKGTPSTSWWAEYNGVGMDGDFLSDLTYLPLGQWVFLSPRVSRLSCRPYSVQSIFTTGIS